MRYAIIGFILAPVFAFAQTADEVAALVEQFQEETLEFARNVGDCTAFEQTYMSPGTGASLLRSVEGETDGLCDIVFEAVDPEGRNLRCRLDPPTLASFADGWTVLADNVLPDGSYKVSYPSDTPDGIRNVMSSEVCAIEASQ